MTSVRPCIVWVKEDWKAEESFKFPKRTANDFFCWKMKEWKADGQHSKLTPCWVTLLVGVKVRSSRGKCFLSFASSDGLRWTGLSAAFSTSTPAWPIVWPLRMTCSFRRPRSSIVWMCRGSLASVSNVRVLSSEVFSCKFVIFKADL